MMYAIEPQALDTAKRYPELARQLYEAGAGCCNLSEEVLRPGQWPDGTVDDLAEGQRIWHDAAASWLNTYASAVPLVRARLLRRVASGEWFPTDYKWRGRRVWSRCDGSGQANLHRVGRYGNLYYREMRPSRGEYFPVFILGE